MVKLQRSVERSTQKFVRQTMNQMRAAAEPYAPVSFSIREPCPHPAPFRVFGGKNRESLVEWKRAESIRHDHDYNPA